MSQLKEFAEYIIKSNDNIVLVEFGKQDQFGGDAQFPCSQPSIVSVIKNTFSSERRIHQWLFEAGPFTIQS